MAKKYSIFVCLKCSYQATKWMGKCPECGEWNSFQEENEQQAKDLNHGHKRVASGEEVPRLIKDIQFEEESRIKTKIQEFDRVVGGGVVPGSLILIGGEPGIGKSTLLTKILGIFSVKDDGRNNVLYVSGEESATQVAERAKRVGANVANFFIYNETNWQKILEQINKIQPKFLVVDSIQTTTSSEIDSAPGSISQIKEVTYELMNNVKSKGITCFIIGHITKEGSIAGPKILEHMVDTVIYFEGDQFGQYRILRAMKNRFGNTNEVGIFEMKESGLQEVRNPSQFFLNEGLEGVFGRSLTCALEGSRSLFIEVQALVVENKFGNGRRTTQGIESNRLAMIVAIIEKYFGIPLGFNDIYLNVVGGIKLQNRESDLSLMASLISSYRSRPIDSNTIFVGEVGLTGEIRSVPMMEMRIKEMALLNYKRVITSEKLARGFEGKYPIQIIGLRSAKDLEKYI